MWNMKLQKLWRRLKLMADGKLDTEWAKTCLWSFIWGSQNIPNIKIHYEIQILYLHTAVIQLTSQISTSRQMNDLCPLAFTQVWKGGITEQSAALINIPVVCTPFPPDTPSDTPPSTSSDLSAVCQWLTSAPLSPPRSSYCARGEF